VASRRQERKTHGSEKDAALLDRLRAGLADTELRDVLVASLRAHDEPGRARLLKRLEPATADVLSSVLARPRRGRAAAVKPGRGKLRQQWDAHWAEWNDCVAEAGLEDGRYVRQDHDWEAPYYCPDELSSDLDAVAKRLRPLLAPVRMAGIAGDSIFFDAIRRLDDELGSGLPEYMDPGSLGLALGPEATACLLEWEGGVPGNPRGELFDLVDAVCRLDAELAHVWVDTSTVARFLSERPEGVREALLRRVALARRQPHWAHALQHARSGWFRLVLGLARCWDPELHAELCLAHISDDFTLAAPLVSDAMKRRDHRAATLLLAAAFRAILPKPAESDWDPRSLLLVLHVRWHCDPSEKRIVERLLRARQKIAQAAGERDIVAALDLQLAAWRAAEDGETMVVAFREMADPRLARVRKQLIAEWSELVAQRTLQGFGQSRDGALEQWVPALVDAAVEGSAAEPALRRSVQRALARAGKSLNHSRGAWAWRDPRQWEYRPEIFTLARLTLDLDARGQFERLAPSLHRLLLGILSERPCQLDRFRKRWFAQLGGSELLDDVAAFWKKHVGDLVPNPHSVDYGLCVSWLVATRELDRERSDRILAEWATAHRLKYTLWKAVRLAGLPMPRGVRSG
jgi:hypothetical protein